MKDTWELCLGKMSKAFAYDQLEWQRAYSLLWICGVFFLNFDYLGQVGNGFFGCWLCAVCSLLMI